MMPALAGTQRFSTDMFAPRDRVAAWREMIGRQLFRVEIEPQGDEPFSGEMTFRAAPGLGFIASGGTATLTCRRPAMADTDDLMLYIAGSGSVRYAACGREVRAQALLARGPDAP